jgi:hypothetical protein
MRAALVLTALACLFNGGFVAWSVADLAAGVRIEMARRVAEANLEQAERKWMACHRSEVYTVGTDIYLAATKKSQLTTAQVPELGNSTTATF